MKNGGAIVNTARSPAAGNKDLLDYSTTRAVSTLHPLAGTHLAPRAFASMRWRRDRYGRAQSGGQEARDVSKFGADTVMKRPAQPEEIAPLSSSSPAAMFSYITGEVLPIIGDKRG